MRQNGNGKRKARRIPEVLTQDDQARLLGVIEAANTPGRLRNLAMVRVFLNTGIRASELIGLQVRDIDWTSGDFLVHGKGSKDRVLALSDDDLALLKSYVGPSGNGNRLVFTSLDGSRPLCGRWLRRFVKRLGEKAGITKRVHCHGFRHTLAVDLLRATNSLKTVQDCLGHENISTTTIYARLVNGEVKTALRNLRNGEEK
jgi:site-specific recombinase XerD